VNLRRCSDLLVYLYYDFNGHPRFALPVRKQTSRKVSLDLRIGEYEYEWVCLMKRIFPDEKYSFS
jgi:hypothetical protein